MRCTGLVSFRFALLTSLGLVHACTGSDSGGTNEKQIGTSRDTDDDATDDDAGDDDVGPGSTCQASAELCSTVEHRPMRAECTSELPRSSVFEAETEYFTCLQDADCTDQPHGYCEPWRDYFDSERHGGRCVYGCVTDDECNAGQVCDCVLPVGRCVPANDCEIDADCAPGSLCARYEFDDGCGVVVGFACTTDQDECRTHEDCSGSGHHCAYYTWTGRRICEGTSCDIGRPFLIDGEERVACVEFRSDWLLPSAVDVRALSQAERQRLSQEWQRVGQMEHASIAAFARFALQLLALGAPPELVTAAGRAMRDETRHAQLVFGIASRYAGRSMGPGPLALDGALDGATAGADWEAIVMGTVLEGCIGETVAALEAKEAATHVADPELKAVLTEIAADEQRHAELAWQFVKWAIQQRPELASRVEQLVLAELQRADATARLMASSVDDVESRWLLGHGVFSEARRAELCAEVLRSVVMPCAKALLAAEAHELANAA